MRRALLAAGLLVLALSWFGPLPEMARHAFYAHMTLHMAVVAIAAPLVAIGLAGGSADPVGWAPNLFAAVPASIFELVVVWMWHTPMLHQWARHTAAGFLAEQGTFLIAAMWLWASAFGGASDVHERRAAGVAGLLLTSMHMTLLGALLALAPRSLYEHADHAGTLKALDDQHLGGALMILIGGISYLAGGLWLTRELLGRTGWRRGEAS